VKITVPILAAVSAAILLAPGASAAPDPSGVYDITGSTGKTSVWTITSNCADQGCTAHVSSSSGLNGDAVLSHGLWTLTVPRADAVDCPDGTSAPGTSIYMWDPATWTGTYDTQHGGTCGDAPGFYHETFTMTKAH
jgi:hypothetical protein